MGSGPVSHDVLEEKILANDAYKSIVSAKDYAHTVIKDAILNMWLEPGTGITEKGMAQTLGLSQTPVREACVRLAQEKLLVVVPQRGTYVAKIDPETVIHASHIRRTLERDAITRIELPVARDIAGSMRLCLQEQEMWLERERDDDCAINMLKADFHFHRLLFEAANLAFVCDMIQIFSMYNQRLHLLCYRVTPEWEVFLDRHKAIFAAVTECDADALLAAWERHYGEIEQNLEKGRKHYPEYFV